MASLEKNLRKDLEKTVKWARRVAEAGARKAVAQLGIGEAEAPKHLTADQRVLRNRLRAHGRQLGDRRDAKTGVQDTARLVQECAYEHWHRMLFTRFLAETDLLIEQDSGVAITLDEVQELAREKATDWLELASDYAERMLPQIFRKDDPVLQIALPPETRSEMEDLLKSLTKPVFEADDSLGWVYQFWQSDKKDEVNKSEVKIGADELPAVTQLFTEDYMVLFLLHNTLGAWWAGKVLAGNPSLAVSAPDEAALRAACKVGEIDWTYLRFVRDTAEDGTEGPWRPAAGAFEGWPKAAKDLTVLDPCMGSGHFLVFTLPILVAFRMAEEGLPQSAAVDEVLKHSLFGLEIDPRCTQIAAFNLAFAAWRKVGYRPLPQLNLACSGLAIGVTKPEWLKLAEKAVTAADPAAKRDLLGVEKNLLTVGLEERVKNGLEALYDLFAKAPWLGSLIDPRRAGADIFREGFDKLEPLLASIMAAADTDDAREMVVAAQGMAKAAEILGSRFVLAITNVPYLSSGQQSETIQNYLKANFPESGPDLATAFIVRLLSCRIEAGTLALVSPWGWFYKDGYRDLRRSIIAAREINVSAILGSRAFEQISGEEVSVSLTILGRRIATGDEAILIDANRNSRSEKIEEIASGPTLPWSTTQASKANGYLISASATSTGILAERVRYANGIQTSDYPRCVLRFWEVSSYRPTWEFMQSTTGETKPDAGLESILRWERGNGELHHFLPSVIRGQSSWGKSGVAISATGELKASLYRGHYYDESVVVLIPHHNADLPALWALCSSADFDATVRQIDAGRKVRSGLVKIPFDQEFWRSKAEKDFPDGLPAPYSYDPTQWLFSGRVSEGAAPLDVGVAGLAGFSWPRQAGVSFDGCLALAPDGIDRHSDADGIVCLTALKGEPPAEQRLNALLADAFGADWSAAKLATLLAEAGFAGKSLDDWLRDGFFSQHCELFQQRPFIWHIWDGRRDGFHALVNYHRLAAPNGEGRRTLEKLIYSYLGDWIDRQRADQKAGIEGADGRLAHAEYLKTELIKILEGEPPYEIFVRWKPLHEQPIGWDPDINDGVRMNIRPFMTARTLNARGANACILRTTPRIKWDKDRGKEPNRDKADYPWFWGWDEAGADFAGGASFDGNRWNDLHYSRALKQAARDRHRVRSGGKK